MTAELGICKVSCICKQVFFVGYRRAGVGLECGRQLRLQCIQTVKIITRS